MPKMLLSVKKWIQVQFLLLSYYCLRIEVPHSLIHTLFELKQRTCTDFRGCLRGEPCASWVSTTILTWDPGLSRAQIVGLWNTNTDLPHACCTVPDLPLNSCAKRGHHFCSLCPLSLQLLRNCFLMNSAVLHIVKNIRKNQQFFCAGMTC